MLEFTNADSSTSSLCYELPLPSGQTSVTASVAFNARLLNINILPLGASVDIPRIILTGGPTTAVNFDIRLGSGSFVEGDIQMTPVGRDWGGLDASGMNAAPVTRFHGRVGRNLLDDVGADQIFRLDVNGTIGADVIAQQVVSEKFIVECGAISSAGAVVVNNGNIHRIRCFGASGISGSITAANGEIREVRCTQGPLLGDITASSDLKYLFISGNIGSAADWAVIRAGHKIRRIEAASIYADIELGDTAGNEFIERLTTSGVFVGRLEVDSLDASNEHPSDPSHPEEQFVREINIAGNCAADIEFRTVTYKSIIVGSLTGSISVGTDLSGGGSAVGIDVNGDLSRLISVANVQRRPVVIDGDVTSTGRISVGQSTGPQQSSSNVPITINGDMEGTIWIGKSLIAGTGVVGVDVNTTGGLGGQIVVNGSDDAGVWTADVVVGSTTVSPEPYYTQLASQLGGGAIGLAPFKFHAQDCTPAHMSVLTEDDVGVGLTSVVVRHYGPVNFATGTFPFTVMETELPTSVDAPDSPCWECCSATSCSVNPGPPLTILPGCLGTPGNINSNLSAARGTNPRDVVISTLGTFKFRPWHTYCIKPVRTGASMLYCEQVTGSPPPSVADYIYRFAIIGNRYDLNRSGDVEYGDVTTWLEEPVDFNGDESADSADLAELIEAMPQ